VRTLAYALMAAALMSVPHTVGAQRSARGASVKSVKTDARTPATAPVHGAQLTVTAPSELCEGATYELEVSRYDETYAFGGTVARAQAGETACHWQFDDMPEGHYIAVLEAAADRQIVAVARGELASGTPARLTLVPLEVKIDRRLTINAHDPE
jgi:hypothetical protein